MAKLFGTDGIRGIANRYPITAEVALKVGRAVAVYFKGQAERFGGESIVLIGKDTRRSSYMLEQAIAAGLTSAGAKALLVGPMPTPGVAFITKNMRCDAGIMVSASHNTYEYNGIKLFGHDGFKLPNDVEAQIEALILSEDLDQGTPVGGDLGRAKRIDDAMGRYVVHSKHNFPADEDLKGMRIVVDSANGAAYKFAQYVFEELGAEVIQIGNTPNGVNINHEVGALHPESLAKLVVENKAHIGIALDGDADRVILVDETGAVIDGDQLLAISAAYLKENNKLKNDTLIATPMSNVGLEIGLKKLGIKVEYADVGDRAVVDKMRSGGFNLGGEQSGHVVYLNASTTGDGVVTALLVLSIMKKRNKKLSELKDIITLMPQVLKNVRVKEKKSLDKIPEIDKAIKAAEAKMSGRGRLFIRYSGTEPLCRIMMEGESVEEIEKISTDLSELIGSHLA